MVRVRGALMVRVRGTSIVCVRGARYEGIKGIDSVHLRSAFEGHVLRASRVSRVHTILGEGEAKPMQLVCACLRV